MGFKPRNNDMTVPKQVVVTVDGKAGKCGHDHPDHYSALPCTRMAKRIARENLPRAKNVDVRQLTKDEAASLKTVGELWGWTIPYHRGRGRPTGPQPQQSTSSGGAVSDMLAAADKLYAQAQSAGAGEALVLLEAAQSMAMHASKLLESLISEKRSTS